VANVNNPHGLKPLVRTTSGGAPQTEQYSKAAAYAQAIFKWDPVTLLAGVLNGPASGITPGTTRYLGVALNWVAASILSNHQVMVSPDAIFEVQGDGSGSGSNVIAAATMGYNANLNVASVAGGGVTRDNSGVQLTESTIATTNTLDMKIRQLLNAIDNAYGVNGRVEVTFNKHLLNPEVTVT
jgi:hypothetical protein